MRRSLLLVGIMVVGSLSVWCQPKPTYYDSLINAQMNGSKPSTTPAEEKRLSPATTPMNTKQKTIDARVDMQPAKVTPAVNEPVVLYDESVRLPAAMWYGNYFSSAKVRERTLPMDSLPDEINMRLVRSDDEFCFPVQGPRSSPYGWRWERAHRGVDIAITTGTPIHCAFPGVVRVATMMGGYGNVVVVRHYNGLETVYGHLSKINVKPWQEVKAGTVLGLGGSTGRSTGPHLHFECRFLYQTFDPEWIIDIEQQALRTHTLHLDKTYFGVTAPRGHQRISYKADESFVAEKPRRDPNKPIYYTTQYGDTYKLLAQRYKITVEELMAMNPQMPKKCREGVRLMVRRGGKQAGTTQQGSY